jgi:hypothetical protein
MRSGRSTRIDSHARKSHIVSSYPAKRVCASLACSTRLSIYNASDYCFLHEPPTSHFRNDILR